MRRLSDHLQWSRSIKAAHWTVLSCSLIITFMAWYISKNQIEEKQKIQFDLEVRKSTELVIERLKKYEDALWSGVAATAATGGNMSYQEWKVFSNSLHIEKKYPGINGIGMIHFIPKNKFQQYLVEQQRSRSDYGVHPEHNESEYWPITYIEPAESNAKAVGLDMAHEQNRYTAAKKARDTGLAQITGPIILVQDQGHTPGFLFYAPFYKNGKKQSVEVRQQNIVGLVYAPFVMKKLMEGTLRKENRQVSIRISDGENVLFDENVKSNPSYDSDPMFSITKTFDIYGRKWKFDIATNNSFKSLFKSSQPMIILICGLIIDLLLVVVFIAMSFTHNNALEYAKKMNERAKTQKEIAINSSRLAALGEMAGGIAHEINNPLGIISATSGVLKLKMNKGDYKTEDLIAHVNKIEETVMRISKIIRGLRTISRDSANDPFESVDISLIIEDALSACSERFKVNGVDLIVDNGLEGFELNCQRVAISQVLLNLLNNAYDAIYQDDKPWIKLRVFKHEYQVVFEVEDSGKGIPQKEIERIFNPFYTTKLIGKGTGLGLSVSKSLVDLHEGSLSVDSGSSNTKFVMTIPIKNSKPNRKVA